MATDTVTIRREHDPHTAMPLFRPVIAAGDGAVLVGPASILAASAREALIEIVAEAADAEVVEQRSGRNVVHDCDLCGREVRPNRIGHYVTTVHDAARAITECGPGQRHQVDGSSFDPVIVGLMESMP